MSYACPICGRRFKALGAAIRHLEAVHGVQVAGPAARARRRIRPRSAEHDLYSLASRWAAWTSRG